MFDFQNILTNEEKILYQGKPNPNVVSKKIFGELFIIVILFGIQVILVANGINFLMILILAITLFFDIVCGYSIINKLFLKGKKMANDLYCLTNIRAIKYDINENKLLYGFLANYSNVYVCNVKNGHGDINMEIVCKDNTTSQDAFKATNNLIKLKTKPNFANMPFMSFESISEPDKVLEIIGSAKKELDNVECFYVSDLSNFINE